MKWIWAGPAWFEPLLGEESAMKWLVIGSLMIVWAVVSAALQSSAYTNLAVLRELRPASLLRASFARRAWGVALVVGLVVGGIYLVATSGVAG